jgi:hypothetical protein
MKEMQDCRAKELVSERCFYLPTSAACATVILWQTVVTFTHHSAFLFRVPVTEMTDPVEKGCCKCAT